MSDVPQLVVALGVDLSPLDRQLKEGLTTTEAFSKKNEAVHNDSLSRIEKMYERVKVANALTVANISGNKEQIQSLQDQLELTKQIGLARRSGKNTDNATKAAEEHMAAIRAARADAEAAAAAVAAAQRAAAMEEIGLQERLDVARARGEKREIAALEEEVALHRAIAGYRNQGLSEPDSKLRGGAQIAALASARKQAKAPNVGKAVEETVDRSRLAVLEEGSAKIPIFGAALEALGPAGLTAAAGVAATAVAMEQANVAAEYAEDVQNTADKLGVTTKALQQYNYVAIASGISTDAMKEALEGGNQALGAFQSNIGATKLKPVFAALGITQEEARKAGNITDLLPEIADKISHLGSVAEQSKIAEKLGLSSILPVLQKGKEGVEELKNEAVSAGAVLDGDMIAKGKAAAEEFKKASDLVSINMKRAFIELAPLIAKCVGLAADMARNFADAMDSFHGIQGWNAAHVADAKADIQTRMKLVAMTSGGRIDQSGSLVGANPLQTMAFNDLKSRLGQINDRGTVLAKKDQAAEDKVHHGTAAQLAPDKVKTPKRAPADPIPGLVKEGEDDVDTEQKNLDNAQAALTQNIMQRAAFQLKALKDEDDKRQDDLDAQIDKINATKGLAKATRDALIAQREQASDLAAAATDAKRAKVLRDAQEAQDTQQRDMAAKISTAMATHLDNEAATAATSAERRKLELQALALRQQLETAELKAAADKDLGANPDHAGYWDTRKDELDDSQSDARTNVIRSTNSPGRAFDQQLNLQNAGLGDQLEGVEVSGVEKLGDELESVVTRTKTVAAAFHDMAQSIVGDLLKIAIKRDIETPIADMLFPKQKGTVEFGKLGTGATAAAEGGGSTLAPAADAATSSLWSLASAAGAAAGTGTAAGTGVAGGDGSGWYGLGSSSASLDSALGRSGMDPSGGGDMGMIGQGISLAGTLGKMFGMPFFKDGTDDAPGGEALVGEDGPELVDLPGGSKVTTNSALRGLPNTGPAPASTSMTMNHNISIDLTGANGEEAINRAAMAAAQQGAMLAIASSRTDMKRMQRAPTRDVTRY